MYEESEVEGGTDTNPHSYRQWVNWIGKNQDNDSCYTLRLAKLFLVPDMASLNIPYKPL